ncbi:MAG TPA: ABC transporter permease [Acidimicrobiales bacterium]|nr:ABC transporter permease [Acidimicrobiales bacterium]
MNLILSYAVVGLVLGCLYALTASGLVVTYTTSGIFNFAHGAIGMFMAFTYWQLAVGWHLPVPLALALVVLVLAPLSGALIERLIVRPLYGASLGITLVVTLGLLLLLLGLADAIWPPVTTRQLPSVFPGQIRVFGVVVTVYELMVLVVSVAIGLRILFTRTRVGITMRAVVDDRDLTARAGASPVRTAQLSWALGASLAALAGILIAPLQYLDQFNLTLLVVTGYAAAVVGRLRSLPLTVAGALLLGLVQSYATGYLPTSLLSDIGPAIPMGLLFIALLVRRQERLAAARLSGRRSRRVLELKPSLALAGAFIVFSLVMSELLSPGNLLTYGQGIVLGVVMLSLVLLTGYGGQVSLCQMSLAGLGAFCMGKIAGGHSILGLAAAVALPAAIGGLLALVVLRLRGIYLALATLAFAYSMDYLFFNHFLGFGGILAVGRVLVQSQRGFLVEVSVLFAALGVGVLALRRGPFGRRLAALNDSEAACASIGMNITAVKVIVFVVAAGIAGLGGALYGGWQGQVGPDDFQMLTSLILLLLVTLGGIDTVGGAFAAAIFYAFSPVIQRHIPISNFQLLAVGAGAIFLGRNPGGFAGQLTMVADRLRSRPSPVVGQEAPVPAEASTGTTITSGVEAVSLVGSH